MENNLSTQIKFFKKFGYIYNLLTKITMKSTDSKREHILKMFNSTHRKALY